MNLEDVNRYGRPHNKRRKRVGRGVGSGHGKMSVRGARGAKARSGWCKVLTREGGQMPLFRRLPKRGFTNVFGTSYEVVNVGDLAGFQAGSVVGPEELRAKRVARTKSPIKILGQGTLDRALTLRAHAFSASALQKIEAAGGKAEVI